ncbi:regulator of Vps4 activity in the MVB pathway protein [Actinidia rufa]|uniref:Regulator of Vps4 activity in the MVB pathway protein n=1 Tax=Actinidia rufa TaxID=165716 RepID=A0A7J0DV58_9ERIC|nr:regulator of Vps4 activity in the MVB pathway protein [Actinidia rufa]
MLHRNFKPAKCKTSLKLASSRLKLLKNKKEVVVKQLKKELAQLLEAGQDQTARIRVEHVVREEKTRAAFDLLEIYCELIVARLPMIEAQKNCPIDLKEAVTSVVFASPRCADIPELQDVRKHFTAKYGKEFISAAVELRPECGVSRMLVEKLSAKAPDGQTKLKILTAIAEEHNVKWDPKSFGGNEVEKEVKPPDDLLNGPSTFEKVSKMMHTEPPIVQPPPQVQAPPSPVRKNNVPVNFEHNASSSTSSQNFVATDVGGSQTTVYAASHHGVRPSGAGSERMEVRHSYYEDESAFSSGRQGWNMEFKDATAAAQAAAESAERASMAARAAAELSSRGKITRQYSTESQKSNNYSSRYEGHTENAASKLPTQQVPKNSGHNSFCGRNPQRQTDQVMNDFQNNYEHDNPDEAAENIYRDGRGSSKRSSQSSSNVDDKVMNDFQKGARNSQKSSFKEEAVKTEKSPVLSGKRVKKQSIGSEDEFVSSQQGGLQSDKFNYFGEERIKKQASNVSSRSNSSNGEAAENVYSDGRGSSKNSGRSASIDEDKFANDFRKVERNPQRSSFEEEAVKADRSPVYSGMSMKKQSIGSEDEFVSGQQGGLQPDNFNYFAEERITKQASSVSSCSHSSNGSDGYGVSPSRHQKLGIDGGDNPFVGIDQGIVRRDTVEASSYNDADVVFDESISNDYVGVRFDSQPKYDRQESRSYSASPPKEPHSHLSVNTDTWSPRQSNSRSDNQFSSASHVSAEWHLPPVFDESLTKSSISSPPHEDLPVTYDESEGLDSESEDELHESRLGRKTEPSSLPREENIFVRDPDDFQSESHGLTGFFRTEKHSGSNRKQNLHYSFDDEKLVEVSSENNQRTEFSAQSRRKFGFDETASRQSSSSKLTKPQIISNDKASEPFYNQVEERKSRPSPQTSRLSLVNEVKATQNTYVAESYDTMEDDESFGQSSLESGKELNFGTLTGGLRNKGYGRPPYIRNPSVDASPSRKVAEDNAATIEHPPDSPVGKSFLKSGMSTKLENKPIWRRPITNYDLDTDDSDDLKQQNSRREKEPYSPKASKEELTTSRLRAPVTVFDTDNNDYEEDLHKQAFTSTGRPGGGLSRRTKATPGSGKSSYSKMPSSSETPPEPRSQTDTDAKKVPLRSYRFETPPETRSQIDADAKKMPSRSSYRSETPPEPRFQTDVEAEKVPSRSSYRSEISPDPESQIDARSSYHSETPPEPRFQTDAEAKRMPSRSSYHSKTAPEPQSQTDADAKRKPSRSSYRSVTPPEPRSQTDADPKRMPSRSSYGSETPPEPRSQTDADAKKVPSRSSYRHETAPEPQSQIDADAKRKPSRSSYRSETPPEPRSQADADPKRMPSRSSYGSETPPEPRSQTDADAKKVPSRTSYRHEMAPEPQSQTDADAKRKPSRSSYRSETPPEPRSQTDADPKRMPSRSSYGSETPPEPRSQTDADAKKVPSRSSYRHESPPEPRSRTDADAKKVPPSRSSYHSDTPPKPCPQPTNSSHREHSPAPSAAKQATSKPKSDSSVSTRKENLKSSVTEQPSSPLKTAKSGSTESPKASTSSGETPSRESSLKKTSHVHPKLPDYDTLTAHFLSLRVNRQ